MVKFNIYLKDWNSLVMAILWSLWLNRNLVIFRQRGKNLSSLLYQILHLTSCWVDTLLTSYGSTVSSMSQAIQQMQHDLDQVHAMQASSTPLVRPINIPVVVKIPSNLGDNSAISPQSSLVHNVYSWWFFRLYLAIPSLAWEFLENVSF